MAGASYDRYNAYVALPQIEKDVAEVKKIAQSQSCPFPVGSVLMFNDATNPNETWAGTEWDSIGSNCYLVGAGTHTVGTSGGSNTRTLTTDQLPEHSHSLSDHSHDNSFSVSISGEGTHNHTIYTKYHDNARNDGSYQRVNGGGTSTSTAACYTNSDGGHSHTVSISGSVSDGGSGTTGDAGSDTASLNVEPAYYSVAIWTRTA